MKRALLYIPDLFFAPRIADALAHLGFTTSDVGLRDDPAAMAPAEMMVVQLDGPPAVWRELITRARAADIPVLAFGRHTEAETLRAARQAGAGKVVPNSELVNGLPQLIEQLLAAHTGRQEDSSLPDGGAVGGKHPGQEPKTGRAESQPPNDEHA
jgi:hypothetical protein